MLILFLYILIPLIVWTFLILKNLQTKKYTKKWFRENDDAGPLMIFATVMWPLALLIWGSIKLSNFLYKNLVPGD